MGRVNALLLERVIHADWGVAPGKRWMARGEIDSAGTWRAGASELVGDAPSMIARARAGVTRGRSCLFGFDFPIGLPKFYASAAKVSDFVGFLADLERGRWTRFADVAESRIQISLERPFYPMRPGGTSQSHLLEALGASEMDDLRRECERKTDRRRAACPLFWTLGGQQVGKGALSGWKEVVAPAVRSNEFSSTIWPFSGGLEDLVGSHDVVIAETYPAEFYGHLGVSFSSSRRGVRSGKQVQGDRTANAPVLLSWARANAVELATALVAEIEDGFGCCSDGEDRFDAVVGLFGMLNVVLGNQPAGAPQDDAIASVEGWIFGQQP